VVRAVVPYRSLASPQGALLLLHADYVPRRIVSVNRGLTEPKKRLKLRRSRVENVVSVNVHSPSSERAMSLTITQRATVFIVICSWCQKYLHHLIRTGDDALSEPVSLSHTICATCDAQHAKESL